MTKFLIWFQIIPAIIKAVRELEDVIPIPGVGGSKLNLLLDLLKTFYEAEESIRKEIPWGSLVGVITKAVGVVVAAFNSLGIFKKNVPQPTEP